MKHTHHISDRILALVLALVMMCTLCPDALVTHAYAAQEDADAGEILVEEQAYDSSEVFGEDDAEDFAETGEDSQAEEVSQIEEAHTEEEIGTEQTEENASLNAASESSEASEANGSETEESSDDGLPSEDEKATTTLTEEEQAALLEQFESLDLDLYRAQVLNDKLTKDGEAFTTNNTESVDVVLKWWTPSEILYDDIKSNPVFVAGLASWKGLTFQPSDLVDEAFGSVDAYELILLDMLEVSAEDPNSDILNKVIDDAWTKRLDNVSKVISALKKPLEKAEYAEAVKVLTDIDVSTLTDTEKEAITDFLGGADTAAKTVKKYLKEAKNLYDFANKLSRYQALSEYFGTTMPKVLEIMENNCNDEDMVAAIEVVKNFMIDDGTSLCMDTVFVGEEISKECFKTVTKALIDALEETNPALKIIEKGQDVGTQIANKLFNTENIYGKIYTLIAYDHIITSSRAAVKTARSNYLEDISDSENAQIFLNALDIYMSGAAKGCDYANDFAEAVNDAGISKWVVNTDSNCQAFKKKCESIQTNYTFQRDWLMNQVWKVYFQELYPDLWVAVRNSADYASWSFLDVPVESLTLDMTDITVKPGASPFRVKGTCSPANATCQNMTYESSNTEVATVSGDGWITINEAGKTGSAKITVTCGGQQSAVLNVTVSTSGPSITKNHIRYALTDDSNAVDSEGNQVDGTAATSIAGKFSAEFDAEVDETVEYLDKTYVVTEFDGVAYGVSTSDKERRIKSIKLPETVQTIGDSAFRNFKSLTKVNIPDRVTSIGTYAFYYCESLTNINIPDGITAIPDYAFAYCKAMTSWKLPDSITTIGDYAFCGYKGSDFTIPEHVSAIGSWAFGASSLTSITIPEKVLSIGSEAFENCTKLTKVTILGSPIIGENAFYQDGVLTTVDLGHTMQIGLHAFYDTAIESIDIPDTVVSIEEPGSLFWMDESIQEINVSEDNKYYSSEGGVLYNKRKTTLLLYPEGKAAASFTVPSTVVVIGKAAFLETQHLQTVTMPAGLITIESQAFMYSDTVTSVNLPSKLETIGSYAFQGCKLTSVSIPKSLTSIGYGAFASMYSLKKVTIPKDGSLTSIDGYAFSYDPINWGSLVLPASLRTIGDSVFRGNTMTSLTLPAQLCTIGKYAFSYVKSFKTLTIPATVSRIGEYAFTGDALTDVTFRGDVPYFYKTSFDSAVKFHTPSTTAWKTAAANRCNSTIDRTKADISKCTVKLSKTSLTYTGKALTTGITVTNGKTTIPTYNYTVTWSNNINPGKATVTLTGLNTCYGTIKKTITILPKGTSLSSVKAGSKCFTAKWVKQAAKTNGYQLQYATVKTFAAAKTKTVTVSKNTTVTSKVSKLKKGTTYYVRVRTYVKVGTTKYYSSWSAVKSVKAK